MPRFGPERVIEPTGLTLSEAIGLTDQAKLLCSSNHPNNIIHANRAWTSLTNYESHEVLGKSITLLEGYLTDKSRISKLLSTIERQRSAFTELLCYRKDGAPLFCSITLENIETLDEGGGQPDNYFLATVREVYSVVDVLRMLDSSKISKFLLQVDKDEGYENEGQTSSNGSSGSDLEGNNKKIQEFDQSSLKRKECENFRENQEMDRKKRNLENTS